MMLRAPLRRLATSALIAAAIGVGIGAAVWAAADGGLASSVRADTADVWLPQGRVDERVVVVALDSRFTERARASATFSYGPLLTALERSSERTLVVEPELLRAAARTFDEQLIADTLKRVFAAKRDVVLGLPPVRLAAPRPGGRLPLAGSTIATSGIAGSAAATGLQTATGRDAHARTMPLAAEVPTRGPPSEQTTAVVPSVALVAWIRMTGLEPVIRTRTDAVQVGGRIVPTEDNGELRVRYVNALLPGGANVISAVDLIEQRVPPNRLQGKTVLLGVTDPAAAPERIVDAAVGRDGRLPGVFVLANALNTLLTREFLAEESHATTALAAAFTACLVALGVLVLPLWACWVVPLVASSGFLLVAHRRFSAGTVSDLVLPLGAIALAFIAAAGGRAWSELSQRRRVTTLFSQYVPETVAQRLVDENRAELAADGQRLDMTVLFCDLRGFTALSETLTPSTVRVMLNHYYDRVTDLVLSMRGTLMKYVGDEVFAVWGAPIPTSDHASQALACALAIQQLTPELGRELLERNAPTISFGIGLNTGEAVAAHFGSHRRRQYDVVGDTVNVGARLCSIAGRGEIILSDDVLQRVPSPPPVEPVGAVELKGVTRELRLWRVVKPDSDTVTQSSRNTSVHDADEPRAGQR
jgi:adenylate cyclase